MANDITAHERQYEAVCVQCRGLVRKSLEDGEEMAQRLENLEERWNGLQIITEDIQVSLHGCNAATYMYVSASTSPRALYA